ncbi:hypothetical protein GUITHDRAFT_146923 [Guillardia theta CCMP2712]|uniref:Uncharacterized protein n=1 Tax=Guillardia theta (strain CCMP2712) TaxID=905079 RepID=L1IG73_GUITC|nr:hypothetical protein GUITHDRAFT_146923 [Guillardia theta CCMP2712]EKX34810.1 hypothetical protein GUITHDRAFT_146923 [Guillardia theta CCMP2712]|eukprot:XP_005821790.1 hypothetical protein GUITHDRAFT_146923 [Guillardia theta CCMP2712]
MARRERRGDRAGRTTAGVLHRPLFKLAGLERGKVVARMSRRPPADTFDSVYSQPGPSPANVSAPIRPTAAQRFGSPHPNFMAYNSPFQAAPKEQSFAGVSALVDFRDGIQIVEDEAELDRDVSSDFLQRNGRRGVSSRGIASKYHDDDDETAEAEEETVSASAEDVRSMVEENLRRNCKSRYSSLSALAGRSGDSSLKSSSEGKLDKKADHDDILKNVRESLKEIRLKLSGETPGGLKDKAPLLFYRAQPQDHWINRLVSWLDPPYVHVELRFEDGMASSIFAGEVLFFRPRSFANPHYHIETLTAEERGYQEMYLYCQRRAAQNVRFDNLGLLLAALPLYTRTPIDRTFCSRHVVETLQMGNVPEFLLLSPHRTTPTMIFKAARNSGRTFFSSVPFKISMLERSQADRPRTKERTSEGVVEAVTFRR